MENNYLISCFNDDRKLVIRVNTSHDELADMIDRLRSIKDVTYVSVSQVNDDLVKVSD